MRHRFKDSHLAQKPSCSLLITKDVLVAFACILTLRLQVYDLHNSSIGPSSQLFHQLEISGQPKVLVQVVEAKT